MTNVPSAAHFVTRLAPGAKLCPSVMKMSPAAVTMTSVGSLSSGGSPGLPRSPMVRRWLPSASNFTTRCPRWSATQTLPSSSRSRPCGKSNIPEPQLRSRRPDGVELEQRRLAAPGAGVLQAAAQQVDVAVGSLVGADERGPLVVGARLVRIRQLAPRVHARIRVGQVVGRRDPGLVLELCVRGRREREQRRGEHDGGRNQRASGSAWAVLPPRLSTIMRPEGDHSMSTARIGLLFVVAASLAAAGALAASSSDATTGVTPEFKHIGKLAFGPEGVIFAADGQEVTITALQLGERMAGGAPGTQDVARHRRQDRRAARHRRREPADHRHGGRSQHAQHLHLGDARAGRGRDAGPAARGRRGRDRG